MANIQTIEEAIALAKSAFETGHITDLITGKGEYVVPPDRNVPGDLPTDFEYVLRVCIYRYFKESGDSTIPQKFKNALIQILQSNDEKQVWCAYMMLRYQCIKEGENHAAFSIIDDNLIKITHDALLANKKSLEKCFLWGGKGKEKGMWENIEKGDAYLSDKYGIHFL